MKKAALPVIVLAISSICFAQDQAHSGELKAAKNKTFAAPRDVQSMLLTLKKARSRGERINLFFSISKYYADDLKIDSALFYSEKIKEECQSGGYEADMAKHYLAKSYALYFRDALDERELHNALQQFSLDQDQLFLGYTYKLLAKRQHRFNNYIVARKHYHTAIHFLSRSGETGDLQRAYADLGSGFTDTYETDSAAHYLILSLQLAEKINDPTRIFLTRMDLAELYLGTENLEEAEKQLEQLFKAPGPVINKVVRRNSLALYANCLLRLAKFDQAKAVMSEYETLNARIADNWGQIMLNNLKGKYHFYKRSYTEASDLLSVAYSKMKHLRTISDELKGISYFLGRTEFELGRYDSAIRHLSHAVELSSQLNFSTSIDANLYISQAYEKKGNKDSALHYFRIYDYLKDSMMSFRKEKAVLELTTQYETEKKEQQIRLLRREQQLTAAQIETHKLLNEQKTQQVALLSQQNEISRLEASEKTLALGNQQKEILKKQNELALLQKEIELQEVVASKESQRKKFAYLGIAVVLIFCGYVYYRFVQHKNISKKLAISLEDLKQAQTQLIRAEKEKEAENIRVRISRDIHDEVGATLSGVAMFSEIAKQKIDLHQSADAQVYLDHITINSKEMVEKMSDIVWAINPQNDSFERIIAKLRSYATNLCAGKGLRFHVNIDEAVLNHRFPMQMRKNIYMVAKEAITNAVKYSGGKNITLSLHQLDDEMTIKVRDDGAGFDLASENNGNGLNNMQARAFELGADLAVDTAPGFGTSVIMQLKYHPAG